MTDRPVAETTTRNRALLATLRSHPAPRYVVTGTITFLIDIGSLKLLHGIAGMPLLAAVVVAFCIAFLFNFTASRQWTFARAARDGQAHRQLLRYLALVAVNLLSTVLIVAGFSAVGLNYLIAKVVAGGINACGNFFAYRHWIFAAAPVL
jgi:putative flippase GtrA